MKANLAFAIFWVLVVVWALVVVALLATGILGCVCLMDLAWRTLAPPGRGGGGRPLIADILDLFN